MDKDICKTLGVFIESPYWEEALAQAEAQPELPQWLTADYVCRIDDAYCLLGDKRDLVLTALEQVVKSPALCTFAKALYHIIGKKKGYSAAFTRLTLPKADTLGGNLVGLFPILGHIAPSCEALSRRGVPADVIYDTLTFLRNNLAECLKTDFPRFGESDFSIYPAHLYTNALWIGRLRFEIHPNADRNAAVFANKDDNLCILLRDTPLHASGNRLGAIGFTDEAGSFDANFVETDSYYEGYAVSPETCLAEISRTRLSKNEWQCIFAPGDTLLKVHIPNTGKLLDADCEAAYARAREIFTACYPEYTFNGFICCSWLLCPALADFLKPDANIVKFQKRYAIFPGKNTAADVFLYVFNKTVSSADEVDFKTLPEENSMQRGIKKLLLDGKYIHQYHGFIPF